MSVHDDAGAVYLIEAALAAVAVIGVLCYVNSLAPATAGGPDGLAAMSSDLLNVIEFRPASLEHPSLGLAAASAARWNESSDELYADILHMLPPGTYCYLETPYGTTGVRPADGADMYARPFIASGEGGAMLDCRLTLWRA